VNLPSQAMRCHLAGITAGRQEKRNDIVHAMWKVLAGKPLIAIVKVRLQDNSHVSIDSGWRYRDNVDNIVENSGIFFQIQTGP